ncbi:6537_t:CDS:2 [Funneliformis geosporum]|nr:6537_t:CDS:2 [Funneliformis geosporum]
MVKSQELLKEIEELRENYFQGIIFPIERITELKKKGEEETEKTDRAIKDKMLNDLSTKPEEVIVANGRSFNYCPCKVVEHKSGRRHYKSEECGEQSNSKELEERKNELEEDKNSKNIYYGMGAISLILVVISVTAVV